MADGGETREEGGSGGGGGDHSFQLMDEMLSKLMILGYEKDFCVKQDVAPFPFGYFAVPSSNTGLQFQHFVELASYLAQLSGRDFVVDELDDPNTIVANLMAELRDAGFEADFPAMKLRQAHGEAVCRVLNFLSDLALHAREFRFAAPEFPLEGMADEEAVDDGAEVGSEEVEEEEGLGEGGGGEEVLFSEEKSGEGAVGGGDGDEGGGEVLEGKIDASDWKVEVARVSVKLRQQVMRGRVRDREWRAHLDEASAGRKGMEDVMGGTCNALERLSAEASSVLERVVAKEKFLNTTFGPSADQFRAGKSRLEDAKARHDTLSTSVADATSRLASLTDALEEVQTQLDDRGASAEDASPLVRIKAALAKLRSEMRNMDLRIGVLGHTIMQAKVLPAGSRRRKKKKSATGGPEEEDADEDDEDQEEDQEFGIEDDQDDGSFRGRGAHLRAM